MKLLTASLILILVLLQCRFWVGADSYLKVRKLKKTLAEQQAELIVLENRNQQLIAKIENLKQYPAAIEEQARYELGMIKQGEKYYQVVEPID